MLMMTASLLLKMVEPGGAMEQVVAVEAEMVSGGARREASSWRGCRGCPSLHCRSKSPEECDTSFTCFFSIQPKLSTIQRKVQKAVGWNKGFPGAQPVSMDRKNIGFLAEMPYMVSWKADGTRCDHLGGCIQHNADIRYMMLVDGDNEVYFLDRDNCVFQVEEIKSRLFLNQN